MYLDKTIHMFWERVEILGANDCWPWRGMRGNCGYGRIYEGRKEIKATHIALFADGRPRVGRLLACHSCDNPECVNPAHLWWGTAADNVRDMIAKGRAKFFNGGRSKPGPSKSGYVAHNSKRTPAMISDALNSPDSLTVIAKRHNVSSRTIVFIRTEMGATARHIPSNLLNTRAVPASA